MDETPWNCPECTFANHGMVMSCEICGTKKPLGRDKEQDEKAAVQQQEALRKAEQAHKLLSVAQPFQYQMNMSPLPMAEPPLYTPPQCSAEVLQFLSAHGAKHPNASFAHGVENVVRRMLNLGDFRLQPDFLLKVKSDIVRAAVASCEHSVTLYHTLVSLHFQQQQKLRQSACDGCKKRGSDVSLNALECGHLACFGCIRKYVLSQLDKRASGMANTSSNSNPPPRRWGIHCIVADCVARDITHQLIRVTLSAQDYERYSEACLQEYISVDSRLAKCANDACANMMTVARPNLATLHVPDPITEKDDNGKVLTRETWLHFNENRVRCPKCNTTFCASCQVTPYHKGWTCAGFKAYNQAAHCRFCDKQLNKDNIVQKPLCLALRDVCTDADCTQRSQNCCRIILECGHPCGGVVNEAIHLPCLHLACIARSERERAERRTRRASGGGASGASGASASGAGAGMPISPSNSHLLLSSPIHNPNDHISAAHPHPLPLSEAKKPIFDDSPASGGMGLPPFARVPSRASGGSGLQEQFADTDLKVTQSYDDLCSVCWVEGLRSAPCIQLQCGHVFHSHCVDTKLTSKWPGTRITFGFLNCSLCKQPMTHRSLQDKLRPTLELFEAIKKKALVRLSIEGMDHDPKLSPGGKYHGNAQQFALDSFAYYNCFKCKKAYFGGKRDCEQNADADNRPPEEFICFDCCEMKHIVCDKPGHQEYHVYKCRFCCDIAVWFCWGTTHFCDYCHSHDPFGRAKWDRSKFTPCKGKEVCKLRVAHAPNGSEKECEFALGCGLCLDDLRKKESDERRGSVEKPTDPPVPMVPTPPPKIPVALPHPVPVPKALPVFPSFFKAAIRKK